MSFLQILTLYLNIVNVVYTSNITVGVKSLVTSLGYSVSLELYIKKLLLKKKKSQYVASQFFFGIHEHYKYINHCQKSTESLEWMRNYKCSLAQTRIIINRIYLSDL